MRKQGILVQSSWFVPMNNMEPSPALPTAFDTPAEKVLCEGSSPHSQLSTWHAKVSSGSRAMAAGVQHGMGSPWNESAQQGSLCVCNLTQRNACLAPTPSG